MCDSSRGTGGLKSGGFDTFGKSIFIRSHRQTGVGTNGYTCRFSVSHRTVIITFPKGSLRIWILGTVSLNMSIGQTWDKDKPLFLSFFKYSLNTNIDPAVLFLITINVNKVCLIYWVISWLVTSSGHKGKYILRHTGATHADFSIHLNFVGKSSQRWWFTIQNTASIISSDFFST